MKRKGWGRGDGGRGGVCRGSAGRCGGGRVVLMLINKVGGRERRGDVTGRGGFSNFWGGKGGFVCGKVGEDGHLGRLLKDGSTEDSIEGD